MALLEERYQPGLSTKEALALALDCCRALQQPQPGREADGDSGGQPGEDGVGALDVALISPEGVQLLERLTPPEALLALVGSDEGGEGDEEKAEAE